MVVHGYQQQPVFAEPRVWPQGTELVLKGLKASIKTKKYDVN